MKKYIPVLAAVLSLYACGGEQPAQQEDAKLDTDVVTAPATASGDVEGGPVMTFEKDVHDFGTIIQGEKVSYSFKFTNTGGSDLLITDAKGSCGCTVPEWPKTPIKPGETGNIDVVFDSTGKNGQQNKKVTITANTVPGAMVLAINGTIEVPEAK
ncbi:MAG: DUF1573 domain-containing protein [Flavobacteriales bacterium]|nr:DUF1573 domain-containing protein [Flavobacteriales bacterium]